MAAPAVTGQRSFDDLGSPLHDVTFVVVDLEIEDEQVLSEAVESVVCRWCETAAHVEQVSSEESTT